MKDRIAKSIFWLVWSRGVIQILSFATTLIVARWLDPSDYGLMALAGIWIAVLGLICELGLGGAIIQFRDLDRKELNLCFHVTVASACFVYACLFVSAPAIASWFNSPALTEVLRVASLTLPISALGIVPNGLLQKRLEMDLVTKAEMAGALISIAVVFGMAWIGAGVWALVSAAVVQNVVRVTFLYFYMPWWPGLGMSSARLREILRFSLGSFSSRALWAVYDQSDSFVLGKVAGQVVLGFYTMARDLASVPVSRISSIVNQLSGPLMANLQDDPAAMRNVLLRGVRLTASVSVPLCVMLFLVAEDFVYLALSEKWLRIVPILQVLCAVSLIKSIDVLIAPVLRARFRTNFLATYNLFLLLLMPIAFLIGALFAGGTGVALAWLVVYPLVMARMATEAFREIDLAWRTFLSQLRGPLLAAVVMGAAVTGIHFLLVLVVAQAGPFVRLLLECGIGAVVYCATLWLLGGPLRAEIREVLTWLFKPRLRPVAKPP